MKNQTAAISAIALFLASCSGRDGDFSLAPVRVAMHQTTVSAGVVNNIYKVPSEPGSYTVNYETRTLEVVLSVELENAVAKTEPVTVDIVADTEQTASLAVDFPGGVVLPSDAFFVPPKLTLDAGETEKEFRVSIDLEKLETGYPAYHGHNMLLSVRLDAASRYEVSRSRNMTLVVIDGSLFIPSGEEVVVGIKQASMYEGESEVSNYYPIPFSGNPGAYLYDAQTGWMDIYMDVVRNGVIPIDGYKATFSANPSLTADAVSHTARGAVLPLDVCDFPSSVDIGAGELSFPFVVRINVSALIENYPELSTGNLVMALSLDSVSKYAVDEGNRNVVISIKASSFYPRDPDSNLVKGGDFSEGSGQYWTFNAEQGHNYEGKVAISNGRLRFSITGARCLVSVWQPVTFEVAGAYNFMVNFDNPDGSKNFNARTHVTLTRLEPTAGVQFDYSLHPIYCMADVWGGDDSGLFLSRSGSFFAEGVDLRGVDSDGIFTIGEDNLGVWYLVIGGYSYNDGSLNVSYDDIFIGEVLD